MPHTITLEDEGLLRKFSGTVSGEEILASNSRLHTLPEFRQIRYVINDFSAMRDHSIEFAHTGAYATSDRIIANTKGTLKIALIVTRPDLVELARHYREQMKDCHFQCEIFPSPDRAREWARAE